MAVNVPTTLPSSVCGECISSTRPVIKIGREGDKFYHLCKHMRRCHMCGEGTDDDQGHGSEDNSGDTDTGEDLISGSGRVQNTYPNNSSCGPLCACRYV